MLAYRRTLAITRRAGINLVAGLREGWLTRDELALLVAQCADCAFKHHCLDYLSERPGAASAPPEGCASVPLISRVAPGAVTHPA